MPVPTPFPEAPPDTASWREKAEYLLKVLDWNDEFEAELTEAYCELREAVYAHPEALLTYRNILRRKRRFEGLLQGLGIRAQRRPYIPPLRATS